MKTTYADVAAIGCGKQPSSTNKGPRTMPPPIPSSPAAIPAKTHIMGYNAVVLLSHCKSPSSGSCPRNVFSVARSSVFLRIHAVAAINTPDLIVGWGCIGMRLLLLAGPSLHTPHTKLVVNSKDAIK